MRVIGVVGRSGAGKTTLIVRLIPELNRRGFSVSTIKHARDDFDIDESGKDSFQHRALGANEVVVASTDRLALVRESRGPPEPPLADLLRMLTPVDLVLIEGARREAIAKIEVYRVLMGKPDIFQQDPYVVGIIGDSLMPNMQLPHASIDNVAAAADLILAHAEPVQAVLRRVTHDCRGAVGVILPGVLTRRMSGGDKPMQFYLSEAANSG
jgi:molybdopterin-guanine dinucleotide biosynthesis adapter protein